MTQLSANFSLEEVTKSPTATSLGLNNQPTKSMQSVLEKTCEQLEGVRTLLGNLPIEISSGYRGPQLNAAVKGVSNSAHCLGHAIDFVCPDFGTPFEICRKIITARTIKFDQVIHEYGRWVHISFDPRYRMEALSIFKTGRYLRGILPKP